MTDPGKLYDWLEEKGIEMTRHWEPDTYPDFLARTEFEELFRAYIEEVTDR